MMHPDFERLLFASAALPVAGAALFIGSRQRARWMLLVGVLLLLNVAAELLAPGRVLFGQQPFLAGSGLTRLIVFETDSMVRRTLEPWALLFTLTLSYGAVRAGGRASVMLVAAVVAFCLLRASESMMLSHTPPAWIVAIAAGAGPTSAAVSGVLLVGISLLVVDRDTRRSQRIGAGAACFVAHCILALPLAASAPRPLVAAGAHYYSWFPENWAASYIGQKLLPPVKPLLGEYDSSDLKVFEQHVGWAKEAGIEFFIFDWWAKRPNVRRRVLQQAEWLDQQGGLRFALHFEALDLKERKDTPVAGEDSNVVVMTPERAERLKRQWEYLAKHYMHRPSYLRERGAAVLFVYATRHLVGPVRAAVEAARNHVREQTGVELFIVGDEVYFNALRYEPARGVFLLPEGEPDWDRVLAFDAITAYNPYDESRPQHGGASGAELFLNDVEQLYARFRGIASTAGIRFVPTVLPGYNDRGVRPKEEHFVIPRWIKGASFFERSLARLARCRFTQESGWVVVTSWNEWNEGTQIEPAAPSPLTREDLSGSEQFSQGEPLSGYGSQHLAELRALPRHCP